MTPKMKYVLFAFTLALLVPFPGCESRANFDAKRSARIADEILIAERMERELADLENKLSVFEKMREKCLIDYQTVMQAGEENPDDEVIQSHVKNCKMLFERSEAYRPELHRSVETEREKLKLQFEKIVRIREGVEY
jgi:hypothetical protein